MGKKLCHLMKITVIVLLISNPLLAFGNGLPSGVVEQGEEARFAGPLNEIILTIEAPLFSHHFLKTPVALVNDEPITLGELAESVESVHSEIRGEASTRKQDYLSVLERMIDLKLIILEARNIGLDETDSYQQNVEDFQKKTLQQMLMNNHLADLELDTEEVEKVYHQLSREMKLKTLAFKNQEDASSFLERVNAGEEFDAVAQQYIEENKAELEEDDKYLKLRDIWRELQEEVYSMEVDSVSKLYQIGKQFIVFKLLDDRFIEDAAIEEESRKVVSSQLKTEKAREYGDTLRKKWVTVDEELYGNLDFEFEKTGFLWFAEKKKVDFDKFLQDQRTVAVINADPPSTITVKDFAKQIKSKFFHGVEKIIGKGEVNEKKDIIFENMLYDKYSLLEAREQGLDKTEAHKKAVRGFENKTLFAAFMTKIISPDIKIKAEEVKEHYEEHLDEYSTPVMLRMNSLVFSKQAGAEDALSKLQRKADFTWVSQNAVGLIDKENEEVLDFDEKLLSVNSLPENLKISLKDARVGEKVLYPDPEGYFYVLVVEDIFPSKPKSFDEVKTPIARAIYNEKLNKIMDEWTAKLREAYEVKIFVTNF